MLQASERARQTFRYFWREAFWESRRIVPGLGLAAVKAAFSDNESDPEAPVEHMWVSEVGFDGDELSGVLLNSPNALSTLAEGDGVSLALSRVGDWMYTINDRAYGGFTVNLLRSRMDEAERQHHDGLWGLNFGKPEQPELVPTGAGWFTARAGELATESEHPLSVNMAGSLEDYLTNTPGACRTPNDAGLTLLHELALAGSTDGVRIALRHGADAAARTPRGRTARELAELMGWPRVLALLEG